MDGIYFHYYCTTVLMYNVFGYTFTTIAESLQFNEKSLYYITTVKEFVKTLLC